MSIKQNITNLQNLLAQVNALPEEIVLPELTNPADASKALSGYEFINGDGEKVTGSIPTKTASDLTASGATVTVPAGYYVTQATKSVATATQATPSVSIDANGKITATATQTAGYVSAGTKADTKQLTTQAAKTITPSTSSQTAVAKNVYTTGAVTVAAIPSTYVKPTSTKAATTYTPTTSNQTIAAGTYCSGVQTINGDVNLMAENIKSGVSIFGITGSYEGSSTGTGGGNFPNGTEWTQSNITNGNFYSIYNANGLWVAGGSSGLYYSTNGKTWIQSNITSQIDCVKYSTNGLWVAGGSSGLYYSTDGKTWIQSNTKAVLHIAYGNGTWVATSTGNKPLYSTNGKTWTESATAIGQHSEVVYNDGVWVLFSTYVYYSTNGKTWTKTTVPIDIWDQYFVAYGNGTWVVVSNAGLYYSNNGQNWSQNTDMAPFICSNLCYANGMWIFCDLSGLWTSTDGRTWILSNQTPETWIISDIRYSAGIWIGAYREYNEETGAEDYGLCYSYDSENWISSNVVGEYYYCRDSYWANGIWVSCIQDHGLYYSVTWEPTT